MKIPILFKFLHIYNTQKIGNSPHTKPRKGDEGFTLLEVLVIALIVGILSSIAAPGWLAFINNQRVRTVNDRVLQTLRSAQSEAKRSKRDITVTFNPTPATDPPTVTINPPLPTGGSTQTLNAGGEIKPGTITLVSNANSITFNYLGNVDQLPQDTSVNPSVKRFVVMVKPTGGGAKKCVLIETILGAMITDEGSRCTL
ncbi:pilus assembly FimT family protein [Microcoleus anatoxicus]|uniref:Prepilin-type N-terminal cleavage/methylation domain-containing protein n=1 Tax=Microcoleus anatoxicus PTRS2 TaxID=2705321 RepID=A0ABU8YG01_9CYAN|nr:MAG: prepilin-type N-terminal cleavage/methylation domain-containing protein [Oscillatoriales cyanobacterium]